jgi:hypothetical protein
MRRHGNVFGITSSTHGQIAGVDEDGLPDSRFGSTRPLLDDCSDEFDPRDHRQRRHPCVDALAHQ